MENRKRERIAFWIILGAAILVRCIGFGVVPGGVNQDEAMAGVDAWALSQYGTDRFGIRLPVHFTAWKYGQMSVLLSYCMVPFIKLFGFNVFSIRLPMLLASCGSVALVYLVGRQLFSVRMSLGLMLLAAINPWHFMQSRWSLDCNLLPHVFLLAVYLLLLGLHKRRFLYLSMVFFGLTFYCYGVAAYSVTPFLVVYAAWCLWKRQLRVREVLVCILIFSLVALPEILVLVINYFRLSTIAGRRAVSDACLRNLRASVRVSDSGRNRELLSAGACGMTRQMHNSPSSGESIQHGNKTCHESRLQTVGKIPLQAAEMLLYLRTPGFKNLSGVSCRLLEISLACSIKYGYVAAESGRT